MYLSKNISFWLAEDGPISVSVKAFHYDLLFGKCWDCLKFQLSCFWWWRKEVLCFQLYLFVPPLCCWVFLRFWAKYVANLSIFSCLRQNKNTRQNPHQKRKKLKAPANSKPKKPLPQKKTKQKGPQNLASLTCFQITWHQKFWVLKQTYSS